MLKPLDASCDNVIAMTLGEIAWNVGNLPAGKAGDHIDRGLILLRLLREAGFVVYQEERRP